MAIVRVYDFSDGTLVQYAQVMKQFDNQLAPGNLLHAAGAYNDGFRAIDVFESRDVADNVAPVVAEAAQQAGLAPPEVWESRPTTGCGHNAASAISPSANPP